MTEYKKTHTFNDRYKESTRVREKYPDRIPIIVERAKNSRLPEIDKSKYLTPGDISMGQFTHVVRKRLNISQEKAIFLFTGNILAPTGALMSQIYDEYKDDDHFLYFTYTGENVFGNSE